MDNLALAAWVAKKVRRLSRLARLLPWEDARQAAMLGLVQASRRYDPARCPRFAGFACWAIRAAVQEAARRAVAVTVPAQVVQGTVSRLRSDALQAAAAACRGSLTLADCTPLPAPAAGPRPEEELGPLLEGLPPRPRQVVQRRLEGHTLREVGRELGVTRERARQIEVSALSRLREAARREAACRR
jgi:RNA polymerase nonessential primary-like sigma factor